MRCSPRRVIVVRHDVHEIEQPRHRTKLVIRGCISGGRGDRQEIAFAVATAGLVQGAFGEEPAAFPAFTSDDEVLANANAPQQADLFSEPAKPHPAVEMLAKLDPDAINPRQALDLLYKLKDMTEKS